MQLGFVIDHSRCIGCHACTVACKSENDVPVGDFRTWVKYTEEGEFPEVRRSFAVLRCNQCTAAPCVTICPVSALEKGENGIVDVDPRACIGCKACMQGCPYDALYINPTKGTAEKCHFCAHRVEVGLAPACAVVCPTEAIIPGDFHDPESAVSHMKKEHDLSARKTEAGTGPNVLYRDVAAAGIDPLATNAAGGSIWADVREGPQLDAARFEAGEAEAMEKRARTTYEVAHPPAWGWRISAYLFTKALAAGVFLAAAIAGMPPFDGSGVASAEAMLVCGLGLFFLTVTSVLLVADLKRPDRFYYILTRPNWSSWLARGTFVLAAYGGLLTAWLAACFLDMAPSGAAAVGLTLLTSVVAALSACYTGWLFAQAKGRVLWMRRGAWLHLVIEAAVAGSACLLLASLALGSTTDPMLRWTLFFSLMLHAAFLNAEGWLAPRGRGAEYARAHALLTRGPYSLRFWLVAGLAGVLTPALLLLFVGASSGWALAAVLALIGLAVADDLHVRAGQALSIS